MDLLGTEEEILKKIDKLPDDIINIIRSFIPEK